MTPTPAEREALPVPQRKILDALAAYAALGEGRPSKTAVAAFAGYRPGSGHVNNSFGSLRSAGLIDYPTGGAVALTREGESLARLERRIDTVADVHAAWRDLCSEPQRKLLDVVIGVYPRSISAEALAQRAGYEPGSGHFNNLRGSLRTLGAIEYPRPGFVVASCSSHAGCWEGSEMARKQRTLRDQIIAAVRDLDARQGRVYDDPASYEDGEQMEPALTPAAAARVAALDEERARFVRWLTRNGGLPPGMTEEY